MRDPATIRLLPDGRRLHLNDGPIDLIIEADGRRDDIRDAYEAAAARFVTILDELCAELSLLRSPLRLDSPLPTSPIARRMAGAVAPYRDRCFITPMAAVAGAVAEAVLSAMTEAAQLDRAYVNNGGDIAFHLAAGRGYAIGMVERPERISLLGSIQVSAALPIRGVATSGWRGRSFSLGIADAVTILASSAAQADAAATIIANAIDLPGHPAILRVPAGDLAPDSDLLDLPVTRDVGSLLPHEIEKALHAGERLAEQLRARGLIHAAAMCLKSRVRLVLGPSSVLSCFCRGGLLRPSAGEFQAQREIPRRSLQDA